MQEPKKLPEKPSFLDRFKYHRSPENYAELTTEQKIQIESDEFNFFTLFLLLLFIFSPIIFVAFTSFALIAPIVCKIGGAIKKFYTWARRKSQRDKPTPEVAQ